MSIFMVVFHLDGFVKKKGVVADSSDDAIEKFNNWKEKQEDKSRMSRAIRAYELYLIK